MGACYVPRETLSTGDQGFLEELVRAFNKHRVPDEPQRYCPSAEWRLRNRVETVLG